MTDSIHDYDRRLERAIERVREAPANSETILKFKDECFSQGLSKGRTIKYLYYLPLLSKWLGKDFQHADKADIKSLVAQIESSKYAEFSKKELKTTVKKLYSWLSGEEDYPDLVKWIKPHSRRISRESQDP